MNIEWYVERKRLMFVFIQNVCFEMFSNQFLTKIDSIWMLKILNEIVLWWSFETFKWNCIMMKSWFVENHWIKKIVCRIKMCWSFKRWFRLSELLSKRKFYLNLSNSNIFRLHQINVATKLQKLVFEQKFD